MRPIGSSAFPLVALLAVGLTARSSSAQVDLSQPGAAIHAIRNNNMLGLPVVNPLQPTGNPGPLEKVPNLSDDEGQTSDFHLIHANTITRRGAQVALDGDCEFLVRGYRVVCDYATGNLDTRIFTLRGNIHIDGELFSIVDGRQVTIDFISETYEALDSQAQLSPKLLAGPLRDKLYVKGHDSYGSERETTIRQGSLTTCNYPAPHYEIDGDSIVVRPARRVIFRKTRIKILGHDVLNLPFLSIPLNERTYKNLPYVGESPDEGYFIKMRYGIPTKNPNYNWDTREEYMTKLGLGLGTDYSYTSLREAGTASIYHIFGPNDDLTVSNTHHQVFGWGTLSIQNDYEKDNYLVAPGATSLNTRISILLPQKNHASDKINFTDALSNSNGYSTLSETLSVSDQRSFGTKTQTQLDVNYFSSSSSFQSAGSGEEPTSTDNQRLDVHFQAQEDLTKAQAMLEYQQSIPIGSTPTGQSFIGASDETPVLSLASDARRLFGADLGKEFPFKTTVSWGDFQAPVTTGTSSSTLGSSGDSSISRGFFDFNFNRIDPSKGRFHIDTNGDFKQGIYSDGAAEYVETFGANMRYDLGQNTGLNVRYNYMEPFGYSPLSIDQTGKTDFLSEDLNIRPVRPLLLGAQTGFDILRMSEHQVGWQPIGLRTEYTPAKWFMFRALSTYDTYTGVWDSTQLDLSYVPGSTRLAVGGTYDGSSHTWTAANLFLDHLKWGRTTIAAALSFNGYLNEFESEQLSLIYDLHCAEAIFEYQDSNSGFRAGNSFQFFIRLKAIPYEVPFGVGTRGQPIGLSNTGSVLGG